MNSEQGLLANSRFYPTFSSEVNNSLQNAAVQLKSLLIHNCLQVLPSSLAFPISSKYIRTNKKKCLQDQESRSPAAVRSKDQPQLASQLSPNFSTALLPPSLNVGVQPSRPPLGRVSVMGPSKGELAFPQSSSFSGPKAITDSVLSISLDLFVHSPRAAILEKHQHGRH